MDLVHRTDSASIAETSFDTLARTLGRRLPRRQMFGLLAATLATGALGTTALIADAEAKGTSKSRNRAAGLDAKRRKSGKGKGGKGKGDKGGGPHCFICDTMRTTTTPAPVPTTITTPPQRQPTASELCLAAGNQCGTQAGVQGACRYRAVADNQAGFLCTSNQAGNACTASTQCGAGSRCVIQGATQTCRVVIA